MVTKENPQTFYVGKMVMATVTGFAHKKPQGKVFKKFKRKKIQMFHKYFVFSKISRWRIRQGCPAKKRRRQFMAMSILWARWFPWIDWSVESFRCWVRIFVFMIISIWYPRKNRLKKSKKFYKRFKNRPKIRPKNHVHFVCFFLWWYEKLTQKLSKSPKTKTYNFFFQNLSW